MSSGTAFMWVSGSILPHNWFRSLRPSRFCLAILLVLICAPRRIDAADTNWMAIAEEMYATASWVWDQHTEDFQTCRFWKRFEIPGGASVKHATIRITADNGYRFFLDGREIGQAGE